MPVPATRDEFLDLVRMSGVLDEERVATFARTVSGSSSGVSLDQPQALAQRMVRDGLITTFQAKQLLQGKWKRFLINGKYKLLEPIGAGGMGQVFLCFHVYMHRLVALKVLPTDKLEGDKSALDRFLREARAAAALDHPNIVRAYEFEREDTGTTTLYYLVMEYVDGASLQEVVARRGPMAPVRAAHYIKQAAAGLQHAHTAGLVHRDIKPGNLLLDRAGTVKLLDLGLARFSEPGKDNVTERYDEKNAVLGTADYLAPEQARGDTVDVRADIYSLGATLYFLLTGKAPFEEGTITQKLLWSQTKAPKPVREFRQDVPEGLVAVLERMMAKDANDRYPTPQAVVDALAPWTATPIPPPAADEMPRREHIAAAAASQSHTSLLPSTPAPRSVPGDLVRSRPSSQGGVAAAVASRPAGPRTPAPRPAPKSAPPAAGPRSRPLAPIVRGPAPAPEPPRRRKPGSARTGPARGPMLILAAAGGGALLVIFGIFLAWILVGNKPHHTPVSGQEPALAPRGTLPTPATPQPKGAQPGTVIPPEQAANYLNQRVTVEMTVLSVGKANTAELYFFNSKANYRAEDNFSVTLDKAVLGQLGAANEQDLKAKYLDKTVRVTGVITKYQNKPQIVVESGSQIQVVSH